ncbi:hypothetical protein GCM10027614_45120 [Micromonospora vulcania]
MAQVDDGEEGALGVAEGGESAGRIVPGRDEDGAAQLGGAGAAASASVTAKYTVQYAGRSDGKSSASGGIIPATIRAPSRHPVYDIPPTGWSSGCQPNTSS